MAIDDETIEELATNPAEIESDGQRVKEQSLKDVLAAQRQLAANAGAANANRGLRFTRLLPGGGTYQDS